MKITDDRTLTTAAVVTEVVNDLYAAVPDTLKNANLGDPYESILHTVLIQSLADHGVVVYREFDDEDTDDPQE